MSALTFKKLRAAPGLPIEDVPELLNRIQDNIGAAVIATTIAVNNAGGADVTLTAVGSTPNADGASLSGQALTLQPADATHPGAVSTSAQTLGGGVKSFTSQASFGAGATSAEAILITAAAGTDAIEIPDSKRISFNGATSTAFIRHNNGGGYLDYQAGGEHHFDGAVQNNAAANTDGFKASQNLQRWHIGAGSADYLTSDGVTVTAACPLSSVTAEPASIPVTTGFTTNYAGDLRRGFLKLTADYTAFSAAGLTKDITIGVLPARCRVVSVIADTTAAYVLGGGTIALTVGKTVAGAEYLISHDVKTAPTTKGLLDADLGASLTRAAVVQGGDIPSWSATTTLQARLTSSAGNLNTMSAGSTTFYVTAEFM